ncbi:MAG: molybdopterin cofactor-binding domain-containing protein [Thermomicrobiales bacterium]
MEATVFDESAGDQHLQQRAPRRGGRGRSGYLGDRHPALRYVVIDDCGGFVINPTIVHAWIVGGTVQGIGGALWEYLLHDAYGQLLTERAAGVRPPARLLSRRSRSSRSATPSPFTPLGIKGVGEGGAKALGCSANAVSDACASARSAAATPLTLKRSCG